MSKLLAKIRRTQLARPPRAGALDTLLDLSSLDRGEYIIWCRVMSLLQLEIQKRRESRSPEEELSCRIAMLTKGFCKTCWEEVRKCKCDEANKHWV